MNAETKSNSLFKNNKKSDSANLDDYIYELNNRTELINHHNKGKSINGMCESGDLLSQLEQKEKDLILAAELGKALLERNEQLSRANERITEEYSHKLELLEQEKHGLRRKLDTLEGDFDSRISELQSDLMTVKNELTLQQSLVKQTEQEKMRIVQELIEQNHRLTNELKQSSESESLLANQLHSLREQFNVRRTNLNDHIGQMEGLREEINILSRRKSDLERRITSLSQERENLNMSLEESSDRILMLEKHSIEQENTIAVLHKDLEELKHSNSQLQNKLDSVTRRHMPSNVSQLNGHHSLFNEIEMSSQSSNEDDLRSLNGHNSSFTPDDEIDYDDRDLSIASYQNDNWKLRQELVEIYQSLRRLCNDIQRKKDNSGNFNSTQDSGIVETPEEIHVNQIRSGMLLNVMKELQSLLNDSALDCTDMPCLSCQRLADERSELERLRKEVLEYSEEMKRKCEEITRLTTRVTIQDTELSAVREERDQLKQDMSSTNSMGKEEIVKRAWEVRDMAVQRKNTVEIELAKTRIEVMHINSQLMEAIQQKIELSQQLEQWQVDMQSLIDEQLKKKLTTHEQEEKKRNNDQTIVTHGGHPNHITTTGLIRTNKLLRLWR